MDTKVIIFCEGIDDQIFIADCLEFFYNINTIRNKFPKNKGKTDSSEIIFNRDSKIISVEGCQNFLKENIFIDPAKDNIEEGGFNLVIADADYPQTENQKNSGNNGVINAHHKFQNLQKRVKFDYFLFPNNEIDGALEDVLLQLIPDTNKPLLSCFDEYNICLQNSNIPNLYYDTSKKRKLNNYLHILTEKKKEFERDYRDVNLWQLEPTLSSYLLAFKQFLDKHFSLPSLK